MKKIVVTGANGFIGKNLVSRLCDMKTQYKVIKLIKTSSDVEWRNAIEDADFIIHLAGVNRSDLLDDFVSGNINCTKKICELISELDCAPRIFFSSSTKAMPGTFYGDTKTTAEGLLEELGDKTESKVTVCRLPNIYGKWSKPFYNSVVATFCYQILNNQELLINNDSPDIELLYIDDLIDALLSWLKFSDESIHRYIKSSIDVISVKNLSKRLFELNNMRVQGFVPSAASGLNRRLYATLLSFMNQKQAVISYSSHNDDRGSFSELFKHHRSGQIAFLTSKPGVTRGDHFHHTKVERFVVLSGTAKVEFRNIIDNEYFSVISVGGDGKIIETLPGYAHAITNTGKTELIVVLWANEIFDKSKPDTYYSRVRAIDA